jgi:aspartate/methionine/tyrosine aminotransferase
LGQGVVHYGPPPQATERVREFFERPANHKYQAVDGIQPLEAALRAKLAVDNRIAVSPQQRIVVTAGGNMAFFNALLAIADPDDEIVLLSPYYFNHEMAIAMLNCRCVVVPTTADYQPDLAAIAAAIGPRTRALVTVSPNNPSGAVYSRSALAGINELCRERGVFHVHDEAYEYFTYDGAEHFSPGSIAGSEEYTISLFSHSKSYGMASWRIGYMLLPERLLTAVKKAQDTILICPPVISQYAALGALEAGADFWRPKVAGLAEVRAAALAQLDAVRAFCRVPPAAGAFYLLLEIDTRQQAMTLVERLVREFGVGVLPGDTFGINRGCHLRVAYGALDQATVAEGVGRLVRGLKALVKG